MKKLKEWHFSFGLFASEEGRLVSEEEAEALMDAIIDFVEEKGLAIAGTMLPYEDEE